MANIYGTSGDDDGLLAPKLSGTSGDDTIIDSAGNDVLLDRDGADILRGGAGNDLRIGGAGADDLNGGSGNDRMVGGLGDDTFRADPIGDTVVERAGEGDDLVIASISASLSQLSRYVGRLTLSGTDDIDGTGNALRT